MLIVHYHKATGQIGAWGDGDSEVSHLRDHLIARYEEHPDEINPKTHRIDIETIELIEKTEAEIAAENAPCLIEIELLVRGALAASDQYMMPDRKVANREAWVVYRQALRDLSKLPDVAAMIDAWPVRPDGTDAIAGVRARLAAVRAFTFDV